MVDHKSLLRKLCGQFDCSGQLLRIDQDVIGELESLERCNSCKKVLPQHVSIIGFRLDNMPEAAQLLELREVFQTLRQFRRTKVDPTHHTLDLTESARQLKQEERFLLGLTGLHGYRSVDSVGA